MVAQTIWHLMAALPCAVRDNSSAKSLMGKLSGILCPDRNVEAFLEQICVRAQDIVHNERCCVY